MIYKRKVYNLLFLIFLIGCNKNSQKAPIELKKTSTGKLKATYSNIKSKKPDCPPEAMRSTSLKIHEFKSGSKLNICGDRSLNKTAAEAFFQRKNSSVFKQITLVGDGPRQGIDELSVGYGRVILNDESFQIVKLIPYREKEQIPWILNTFYCSSEECTKKTKDKCVFKQPKGNPSGNSLKKIKAFLKQNSKQTDPRDFNELAKNVPTHQDLLYIYFDALEGHKKSINFFLKNKDLPKKIKTAYEYETPESTFNLLKFYLSSLYKLNCL